MNLENSEMQYVQGKTIEYLQFKKLLAYPEVKHAYVLKNEDMSFRLGTNHRHLEIVKQNLKIVCDELAIPIETVIRPDYNHTTNVGTVSFVDISTENPEISGKRFQNVDGLLTNQKQITLLSTNADCNLILLYDPIKKVIGNIHAGWKGTFGKIIINVIDKMKEEYSCNSNDIMCFFCPSIRKCHFEVEQDVMEVCQKTFEYTNQLDEMIEVGEIKNGRQKYLIDMIFINKLLLKECGIKQENIIDSGICSVCCSDKVHSKRAEGEFFGLGAAMIELED